MRASRGTATLVWVVVTVAVVVAVSALGWHGWIVPAVAVGVLVGLWADARAETDHTPRERRKKKHDCD